MNELEHRSGTWSCGFLARRFMGLFARETAVAEIWKDGDERDAASHIVCSHRPNAVLIEVAQTPMP
jgi:hypothetical protein